MESLKIVANGEESSAELAAKMSNYFRQFSEVNTPQVRKFGFGSFFARAKKEAAAAVPAPKHKPK